MDNFLEMSITYATLEDALLSLGFELTIAEPHRLYYHAAADSIFGLPLRLPLTERVRKIHLSSVRHAVVTMGITDETAFERLLLELQLEKPSEHHKPADEHLPLHRPVVVA